MRKKAFGLGTAALLAMMYPLTSSVVMANPQHSTGSFQLLKLGGHYVKWGESTLGTGAIVAYAFVNESMQYADARNCGELEPMDELADHSGIPQAILQEETAAAFLVWQDAANIIFLATDDPSQADILIGAQGKPIGRAFTNVEYRSDSDGDIKVIDQALICLNPKRRWKIGFDGDTDIYDFRYTLVHEIGHAIGLDHPSPSGQLMSFRYEEDFSDLQAGDIEGVAALYGNAVENQLAEADSPLPQDSKSGLSMKPAAQLVSRWIFWGGGYPTGIE